MSRADSMLLVVLRRKKPGSISTDPSDLYMLFNVFRLSSLFAVERWKLTLAGGTCHEDTNIENIFSLLVSFFSFFFLPKFEEGKWFGEQMCASVDLCSWWLQMELQTDVIKI